MSNTSPSLIAFLLLSFLVCLPATEPIKQACSVEMTKIVVLEIFPSASRADSDNESHMQMCKGCSVGVAFLACFGQKSKKNGYSLFNTLFCTLRKDKIMKGPEGFMKDPEGFLAFFWQNPCRSHQRASIPDPDIVFCDA